MVAWGWFTNSYEKKRSKRQRRKGKIYPFECRVPKNSKSFQSCPSLRPQNWWLTLQYWGLQSSPVHAILQARILQWVAMPSSRGIFSTQESNPCLLHLLHWQMGSLPLVLSGKCIWGFISSEKRIPETFQERFVKEASGGILVLEKKAQYRVWQWQQQERH